MKAKDLRNSILQLAVQGKLVGQDSADEPASVLLEKIRAERTRLIKEKKIKAPKGGESIIFRGSDGKHYEKRIDAKGHESEPVCIEDEIPFEIPESWEWARVSSVFDLVRGSGIKRSEVLQKGKPCVRYGELYTTYDTYITSISSYISNEVFAKAQKLMPGELLSTLTGENNIDIGRTVLNETTEELAYGGDLLALKGNYIDGHFAAICMNSPYINKQRTAAASGNIIVHLSAGKIADFLIAIPPIGEQDRINKLVSTALPIIKDYDALETAREKLDSELPDQLRKSILQMAVQGKLAPQDPNDEPASVLLDRIREQRRQLITEGKMKLPKGGESVIYSASDGSYYEKRIDSKGRESDPVCIDDEIPFAIPESWEWVRLESVASLASGLGYKKENLSIKNSDMVRVLRGGNINQYDNVVVTDSDIHISKEFVDENLYLKPGQIITPAVTSLDNVGKAALIKKPLTDTVCGGFVFFLTPTLSCMTLSEYLHLYLVSPPHKGFCRNKVKKSGQAFYNLSKSALNSALIALPPLDEQKRIVEKTYGLLGLATNR